MRIPYEEGKYIASWHYFNPLNNVHGCVVSVRVLRDNIFEYTLRLSDGKITTITDNGSHSISNYAYYSDCLYDFASRDVESIEKEKNFLEELLKDDFCKAREIAENCPSRTCPLKEGEEIVFYPIEEKWHIVSKMKYATIIGVDTTNGFRSPVYTVKIKDNNKDGEEVTIPGNYSNDIINNFYGFFIGTQDELVRLMVNMIDKTVEEVEKIEELRNELYSEVINTGLDKENINTMTKKLDFSNPIQESSMKK